MPKEFFENLSPKECFFGEQLQDKVETGISGASIFTCSAGGGTRDYYKLMAFQLQLNRVEKTSSV